MNPELFEPVKTNGSKPWTFAIPMSGKAPELGHFSFKTKRECKAFAEAYKKALASE